MAAVWAGGGDGKPAGVRGADVRGKDRATAGFGAAMVERGEGGVMQCSVVAAGKA